ncbi:MAG: 2-octaprenyl-6-methoxyphenyl hydroxylase [Cycloclasticus sp.]|nr:MAG: 2-octaprenyl-6-methoxyphenyl hydroxylase [Cycloclasticus sp.]
MSHDYDVIIIGGGMVGGCLGLALSQSSLRVAIVESREFTEKQSDSAGKRAIALSWGSRRILEQLNIWRPVNDAAMAIKHIHVSDKGHFGKTRLSAASQNVDALGYVIEAVKIQAVVTNSLKQSNIDSLCPASLVDYVVHDDSADVTISLNGKEKTLSCKLLVGADGGLSKVRECGAFELKEYSYDQHAIAGLISVESDVHDVAYERFTSEGPIAMLPHFDGLYSLVWIMPSELAQDVMALPENEFLERLQSRFGQWLGQLGLSGKCQTFPLNLSHVPNNTAERVVLIGNAAHQLHPVAGQGFNLGLRDAAILADALLSNQNDMATVLETYANRRQLDQALITGFTDNVIKLFSTDSALFSVVRNSGLLMLDKIPLMKNQFARQTMGLGSRLARLTAS